MELTQCFDEKEEGFVIVSMSLLCKRDYVIICKHSCPFYPGSMRVLHVHLGIYLVFTRVLQVYIHAGGAKSCNWHSSSKYYSAQLILQGRFNLLQQHVWSSLLHRKSNHFWSFLFNGNKDLLAFNIVQVWHMASPISRRSSFSWDRFWIWNLKINISPKDQTKDFLKLSQT